MNLNFETPTTESAEFLRDLIRGEFSSGEKGLIVISITQNENKSAIVHVTAPNERVKVMVDYFVRGYEKAMIGMEKLLLM